MPQENRKRGRGRRGGEKEKKGRIIDELRGRVDDNDESRPAKRARLSPTAEQTALNESIPLDQGESSYDDRGNDNTFQVYEGDEAQRQDDPPETQFFGMLDESEQAYLKRADLMLENDSFTTTDERAMFLDSVWNEARGKELKIACSQSCSRVLERLIKGSTPRQLKAAWSRMKGNFLALVQHRFASHCVEALFMAAAPVVSAELLGDDAEEEAKDNEYEDDEGQAVKQPAEEFYLETIKEFQNNLGYLITDQFASHTIRVLLLVLSGKPLAGSKSLLQSKKKEKVYAAGKQDPAMLESRVIPDSFGKASSNLIRDTIVSLDTNYLRALATNQLANPVLQLCLEIEFSANGKQKAKDDKSLFRRLLPDDPPTEGTQTATFVKGLLYDPVGSRLLETIVQFAPGKTFKTIYKDLFKDNIGSIVKNDIAGFVIIKILERLSSEELQSATEQIAPQIGLLFERQRHSIIKCLIERCRIRNVSTELIAEGISKVLGKPSEALLNTLLQPNAITQENMAADRKAQLEQNNQVKIHASLLAQSMLGQADPLQQLILDSLITSSPDFLVLIAKDRTATHVLQAALKPDLIDKPARRQIVQKLQPRVAELTVDTVGSHVVDALNTATTGLHFIRERIAEELSKHEPEMKDSYSGRAVWRNWMMDLYSRRRADWVARVKEQFEGTAVAEPVVAEEKPIYKKGGKGKGRYTAAVPHPPARQLTGIEAARERFAAQKRKQGGQGGRGGRKGKGFGVSSGANSQPIGTSS